MNHHLEHTHFLESKHETVTTIFNIASSSPSAFPVFESSISHVYQTVKQSCVCWGFAILFFSVLVIADGI